MVNEFVVVTILVELHPTLYLIVKYPETLCKAERESSFGTNLKLGQVFSVSEDRNVHLAQGPTKDQVNVFVFPEHKFTGVFFVLLWITIRNIL